MAAQEGQEQVPVVIHSDADFVRCPNRSCSALLPLNDDEQICGYCGRVDGAARYSAPSRLARAGPGVRT